MKFNSNRSHIFSKSGSCFKGTNQHKRSVIIILCSFIRLFGRLLACTVESSRFSFTFFLYYSLARTQLLRFIFCCCCCCFSLVSFFPFFLGQHTKNCFYNNNQRTRLFFISLLYMFFLQLQSFLYCVIFALQAGECSNIDRYVVDMYTDMFVMCRKCTHPHSKHVNS